MSANHDLEAKAREPIREVCLRCGRLQPTRAQMHVDCIVVYCATCGVVLERLYHDIEPDYYDDFEE